MRGGKRVKKPSSKFSTDKILKFCYNSAGPVIAGPVIAGPVIAGPLNSRDSQNLSSAAHEDVNVL